MDLRFEEGILVIARDVFDFYYDCGGFVLPSCDALMLGIVVGLVDSELKREICRIATYSLCSKCTKKPIPRCQADKV